MFNFSKLLSTTTKKIGISIGTKNTVICSAEDGILLNEPSVIAINLRTDEILAIGMEAREMLGKTPEHIQIIEPIERGVIADFETAEKMLKYFLEKTNEHKLHFGIQTQAAVVVPPEITGVERKAIEDVVLSAGAQKIYLIESPIASALGVNFPVLSSKSGMVVDLGGGTFEISIIALGGSVMSRKFPLAGADIDNDIVQYIKQEFSVAIGSRPAEQIKIAIGSTMPLSDAVSIKTRGKNLISGLPCEIKVNDAHIRAATHKTFAKITNYIVNMLEVTPPELMPDIYENGVILTGGSSLIRLFDKKVAQASKVPVRIADDPITCSARGAAIAINDEDMIKKIALS